MVGDLTTVKGVKAHMLEASSLRDWCEGCAQVKAANHGNYPSFWFVEINKSGLMATVIRGLK